MTLSPVDISGSRILLAGPGGQVAAPIVEALAAQCELTAVARFSDEKQRQQLEAMGVNTVKGDLADHRSLQACPSDVDYVINLAVVKSGDFDYDLRANAEGIGNLMAHCRSAKAVLHFSSTAVYEYAGQQPREESAPLGDNHRAMFPTYSLSKIAAESVCRFAARQYGIPTTIARLSVPYGNNGGWPFFHLLMMKEGMEIDVHPEAPNFYNLLHSSDYIEKLPYLLAAASTEVCTVNFGGSEAVSIEQWCEFLGELCGLQPRFRDNPQAFGSLQIDTEKMHALIGPTKKDWRQGLREMVEQLAPELLFA